MYRASLRSSAQLARAIRHPAVSGSARRFASTAAGSSSGTWKGSVARWSLAGGALYWYNTSPIFADEAARHDTITRSPASTVDSTTATSFSPDESEFRTVDALLEEKQKAAAEKKAAASKKTDKKEDTTSAPSAATPPAPNGGEGGAVIGDSSPEALEQEASQQGAFNPETGEINWDCPCLGGMADGPCGEDFKAAFSCFVYSTEEPKGMDCIEKFQHMQDCFRQHPEIYAAELADEEEGEGSIPDDQKQQAPPVEGVPEGVAASQPQSAADVTPAASDKAGPAKKTAKTTKTAKSDATGASAPAAPATKTPKDDIVQADATLFHSTLAAEAPEAINDKHVPKAAFDATNANKN
ncbi:Oxidoreductase [Sporothrix curviconia]|uniref:Mitochondrial intermembrane space import and assembly protein 40 n=1 Tax=Sporothrix curviconia TaxID=1260050 RepID=A0ABP0AUA4_9PEZI